MPRALICFDFKPSPKTEHMTVSGPNNRRLGKQFETQFAKRAAACGILAVKNGQEIRYLPGGRMVAVKSQLDWTLVYGSGKVCFVDTKSFERSHFTFAQLADNQKKMSLSFEKSKVLAGFVVLFRACGHVVFYCGQYVMHMGKRSKFTCKNGYVLGKQNDFDLNLLAGCTPVSAPSCSELPKPPTE